MVVVVALIDTTIGSCLLKFASALFRLTTMFAVLPDFLV
jgi:hypothetical protein